MKLKVVPASHGLQWVKNGIMTCAEQPWGFMSLLGVLILSSAVLIVVPLVGPLFMLGWQPVMWMAFMLASRRVLSERRITPLLVGELLKDPEGRKRWMRLGAAYVATLMVTSLLVALLGPDQAALGAALEELRSVAMEGTPSTNVNPLDNPVLRELMLWQLTLWAPVALVFWHTPALVYWGRIPVLKALFFSTMASWRNLGAFAVYGACWIGICFAVGVVVQVLTQVIPSPVLMTLTAVMSFLWVFSAFYASLYFSVVGCFEGRGTATEEDEDKRQPSAEDQGAPNRPQDASDDLPE